MTAWTARGMVRALVAALVCIVAATLLHPAAAAAAAPTAARQGPATPVASARTDATAALDGLSVPVTTREAAAWRLPSSGLTLRTPGGSTVVFRPGLPVDSVGPLPSFRYRIRWWGYYTVFFNKSETLKIAAGAAACAAVVKHIPTVGPYLSTLCALISVVATYARAKDQCVMVQGWGIQFFPQILRYRGNYCR